MTIKTSIYDPGTRVVLYDSTELEEGDPAYEVVDEGDPVYSTTTTYYSDTFYVPGTGSTGILGKQFADSASGLMSEGTASPSTWVHEYPFTDNDPLVFDVVDSTAAEIPGIIDLISSDELDDDYLTVTMDSEELLGLREIFGGDMGESISGSFQTILGNITADIYNSLTTRRDVFTRSPEFELEKENVESIDDPEAPQSSEISIDGLTTEVYPT